MTRPPDKQTVPTPPDWSTWVPDYRDQGMLYKGLIEGVSFCASSLAAAEIQELSNFHLQLSGHALGDSNIHFGNATVSGKQGSR